MKCASALLRSGQVFIQGFAQTISGVWVANGPVYVSSVTSVDEISALIRSSLVNSEQGVPHPDNIGWAAVQQPMLQAVGVKTWAALAKGAKAVGIECENGIVTLTPCSNYANQGGTDLTEQAIKLRHIATELGSKLVEAFDIGS